MPRDRSPARNAPGRCREQRARSWRRRQAQAQRLHVLYRVRGDPHVRRREELLIYPSGPARNAITADPDVREARAFICRHKGQVPPGPSPRRWRERLNRLREGPMGDGTDLVWSSSSPTGIPPRPLPRGFTGGEADVGGDPEDDQSVAPYLNAEAWLLDDIVPEELLHHARPWLRERSS